MLERRIARVRSVDGEVGWVVRWLDNVVFGLVAAEEGESWTERWLKRRLPSIMAAMKVAKMTPNGIRVTVPGELGGVYAVADGEDEGSDEAERS